MKPKSDSRITIQVDHVAHKKFRAACEGMPQNPSLGRAAIGVLTWFSRQSNATKTALISGIDSGFEAVYAQALRKLADEIEGGENGRKS